MKIMRKALALMLVFVIAATAMGCDSAARMQELVGVWECQEPFTADEITELLEVNEFYAEEIAVISVEDLSFVKVLEFKDDGTYRFAYDGEACKEQIRAFFTEALADVYENRAQLVDIYGEDFAILTQAEFEQGYAELFGCASYTELIQLFTDNCYDYDGLSEDFETGTFRVMGSKIYTTIAGQSDEEYLDYKLNGENLTLTYIDAVEEYTKAN